MAIETYCVYLYMYSLFVVAGLVFFQKGRLNLYWLLTYLPFLLVAVVLTTTYLGLTGTLDFSPLVVVIANAAGVVMCCLAISVYCFAISAHSVPVHMWHQDTAPSGVTKSGPYRYVRHPIYGAYMLHFMGAFLVAANWYMLGVAMFGIGMLSFTARKEEREFLESHLAEEYAAYMKTTGTFVPRISR